MIELLAPAGDAESARAAINSGADAVYLGLKNFSARASASNFDEEELRSLCGYAHALGVNVHVALNTLVRQDEVEGFVRAAVSAHNAGADALIVQDIFLGKYLKSRYPQMCLHLSTQAGVNNVYGARMAKEFGFDRVVLARETSLEEIAKISAVTETEAFVQGALCTCFSGQCYLSSFAGGNSGNRGRCKQPCRKLYSIDRAGYEEMAYALSLSDLSVGENISQYIRAGVTSFKIEGRMRRPEYVAAAVAYYRGVLAGEPSESALSELKRTFNRGNYTKGLAFGQDKTFISRAVQGHIGEFCGTVRVVGGRYVCLCRRECAPGDAFKVLRGGREIGGAAYAGKAEGGFALSSGVRLLNGDKVFITTDAALNARLVRAKRLRKINLDVTIACGKPLRAVIDGREYCGGFVPEAAVSRAVTPEDIKKCFLKVDAYPFEVVFGDVAVSGAPFVPSSALNAFRREVYAKFYGEISRPRHDCLTGVVELPEVSRRGSNARTAVIARSFAGVNADVGILKPDDYSAIDISAFGDFPGERYLFLPPFMSSSALEKLRKKLDAFDGLYCDAYWGARFSREAGKPFFAGCGFNVGSAAALSLIDAKYVALSKELTFSEAARLASENTFYLSAGDIKVMDLIYCPFGKTCSSCDSRGRYTLTDEAGRAFALRRYRTPDCAFELYNCAALVAPQDFTGALADCTLGDAARVMPAVRDGDKLKAVFKIYTAGHGKNPVL